jgi:hypothetical protein
LTAVPSEEHDFLDRHVALALIDDGLRTDLALMPARIIPDNSSNLGNGGQFLGHGAFMAAVAS